MPARRLALVQPLCSFFLPFVGPFLSEGGWGGPRELPSSTSPLGSLGDSFACLADLLCLAGVL